LDVTLHAQVQVVVAHAAQETLTATGERIVDRAAGKREVVILLAREQLSADLGSHLGALARASGGGHAVSLDVSILGRAVDRARRLERGRDVLAPIVVVRTGFPLLALEPAERDPDPVDGHLDVVRREQVRRRELGALGRQLYFAVLHLVLPILAMGSLLAEDATQSPVDRT